jgi:putative DNA primase/helicase
MTVTTANQPYIPPSSQGIPVSIPGFIKPDHGILAQRWEAYHRHTAYGLGRFRRYDNGIWPPVEDDIIKQEVKMILENARNEGVKLTAALLSSVLELARIDISISAERWDADPDYLPCANGVLHIPTKSLLPYTPDIYATSQLSFDYNPIAQCPNFQHALGRIPDATDFLQEFSGYALTCDVKHEIAVWLQGIPGSGKSTVISGLQAMLGSRAGLLGLADIEQSRFALGNLPGKTLVVSTEQPETFIKADYKLNAIISGEPIQVERKYQEAITVIPRAKLIWAMNDLPRVNSANNGIMRRVKVIKFPPLGEDKQDPDLKEKIATEGAGILNWALVGLERLRLRGKFFIPKSVQDATREFQDRNDIAKLFLEETNARLDPTDPYCRTSAQYLYDRYRNWCIANGHKPMSSTKVAEEWKRLGFEKQRLAGGVYWVGVEVSAPGLGVIP